MGILGGALETLGHRLAERDPDPFLHRSIPLTTWSESLAGTGCGFGAWPGIPLQSWDGEMEGGFASRAGARATSVSALTFNRLNARHFAFGSRHPWRSRLERPMMRCWVSFNDAS